MKRPRFWTIVPAAGWNGAACCTLAADTDLIPVSEPLSQVPQHDCRMVGKRCGDRPGDARCAWGRRLPVARLHARRRSAADRPLYRLFSDSEDGRHHSFTEALPARLRLGF